MIEVYFSPKFLSEDALYLKDNKFQWSHNIDKKEWINLYNKNELIQYVKLFEIEESKSYGRKILEGLSLLAIKSK